MKRDYRSLSAEFLSLAQELGPKDVRTLRPFAITREECRTLMEGYGTDQHIPARGTIVEVMGISCLVVDEWEGSTGGDEHG